MHPAALDIALDGPYGRSFDYSEHETVVLVAGSLLMPSFIINFSLTLFILTYSIFFSFIELINFILLHNLINFYIIKSKNLTNGF